MKLYAFQPNGHGPRSFFVMAESEIEARRFVNSYLEEAGSDDTDGWLTGGYVVTVCEPGQVVENDNL